MTWTCSLKSEDALITFSTARDLDRQQNYIDLGCQRDLILGYASVSVEMYLDDKDIEAAEMTFNLKLPIDLKPKEIFNYIDEKLVAVNLAYKEVVPAFKLEMERIDD